MAGATRELINRFMGSRRIAVVGASRNPRDFSRVVMTEFRSRGYDVAAVNPKAEGASMFPRVQDVSPVVDAALILTPSAVTDSIVRDCKEAGIKLVWMQRVAGKGAVSESAVEFCRQNGIDVIAGYCPLMFLPNAGGVHRFHGFLLKVIGSYPK